MTQKVVLNPNELKQHPLNKEIYGNEEIDEILVQSIKIHGLLEDIIIKEDRTIISGHRRWKAVLELYPESIKNITCTVIDFKSNTDEEKKLIEYNRQRKKTPIQIMKEGSHLEKLYRPKAKLRKLAGLKGGGINLKGEDLGKKGSTNSKVAKKLGIGTKTYEKHKKVRDTQIKAENPVVKEFGGKVYDEVEKGEKTVNKAYHEIRKVEKIIEKEPEKDINYVLDIMEKSKKNSNIDNSLIELDDKIDELISCSHNYCTKGLIWTIHNHELLIEVINNLREKIGNGKLNPQTGIEKKSEDTPL